MEHNLDEILKYYALLPSKNTVSGIAPIPNIFKLKLWFATNITYKHIYSHPYTCIFISYTMSMISLAIMVHIGLTKKK
jgi:hypothetical protein